MLSPDMILPVTTPLSQQEQLPSALPLNWHGQSLDERTLFLSNNGGLMRINTYVSAGLELGAQRLDRIAIASGKAAVHEVVLGAQLGTPQVHAALEAGNTEYQHPDNFFKPVRNGTGDRGHMVDVVQNIAARFGSEFINPPITYDTFGFLLSGRVSGNTNEKFRSYSAALYHAINSANWDIELRGLAGLLHLHQGAGRNARNLVRPFHQNTPPQVQADKAAAYWESRLAGTGQTYGLAYFLGYRAKSAPALETAMRERWGDENYSRHRGVFTAALNLNGRFLSPPERDALQQKVRRPALRLIGKGDVDAAYSLLKDAGARDQRPFPQASRTFLGIAAKKHD